MTANMINANKKSYTVIISPPFCPFYVKEQRAKGKKGISATTAGSSACRSWKYPQ
jgi:hypothetical protein